MNPWDQFETDIRNAPKDEAFLERNPVNFTMTVGAFELNPIPEWALREEEAVVKEFAVESLFHPFGGRFAYGTTIHHLYHLLRFERATGIDPFLSSVVWEFGGGYGNVARLFSILNPEVRYHIEDLPAVIELQKWYLHWTTIQDVKWSRPSHADLFISTWGLSEAPSDVIEEVFENLDATHGLLAWQVKDHFPDSELFDRLARTRCSVVEPCEFEGSFYGFW